VNDRRAPRPRDSAARIDRALRAFPAGLTMRELVSETGLHENALRRALARLASRGEAHAEPERRRSRGRPELRYRLASAPDAPFREFLPLLLALSADARAPEGAAYSLGHAHAQRGTEGTAAEAVKSSLARLGFAPRQRAGGRAGVTEIALGRCPFSDAVTTSPQGSRVCELHHGLLAGAAEGRGGRLREFVVNDPRVAACLVIVLEEQTASPA
jgi:predicted ArsR family transcriptional regulator